MDQLVRSELAPSLAALRHGILGRTPVGRVPAAGSGWLLFSLLRAYACARARTHVAAKIGVPIPSGPRPNVLAHFGYQESRPTSRRGSQGCPR